MNLKPILTKVNEMGMPLDEWNYRSCTARCGVGSDWATIYSIRSKVEGRGDAQIMLLSLKDYYEKQGLRFGGSVALNDRMHRLYRKCGVREYTGL